MAEDKEERIAEMKVDAYKKDRDLDKKESNVDTDKVTTFNRRADTKREGYVKDNFEESVTEGETERKYGPD